jgi:hypothetical protein
MQLPDHRNINSTMVYRHLIRFENNDFHFALAKAVEESKPLIETSLEYVCTTPDNIMLFRKRK